MHFTRVIYVGARESSKTKQRTRRLAGDIYKTKAEMPPYISKCVGYVDITETVALYSGHLCNQDRDVSTYKPKPRTRRLIGDIHKNQYGDAALHLELYWIRGYNRDSGALLRTSTQPKSKPRYMGII